MDQVQGSYTVLPTIFHDYQRASRWTTIAIEQLVGLVCIAELATIAVIIINITNAISDKLEWHNQLIKETARITITERTDDLAIILAVHATIIAGYAVIQISFAILKQGRDEWD